MAAVTKTIWIQTKIVNNLNKICLWIFVSLVVAQFLPGCHEYLVVLFQLKHVVSFRKIRDWPVFARSLLDSQGLNWHIRFITPLQAQHQTKIGLELGRIDATKWLNPKFVVIMIGVCQLSITHGTLWGCECFDQNTQPADTKICPESLS